MRLGWGRVGCEVFEDAEEVGKLGFGRGIVRFVAARLPLGIVLSTSPPHFPVQHYVEVLRPVFHPSRLANFFAGEE